MAKTVYNVTEEIYDLINPKLEGLENTADTRIFVASSIENFLKEKQVQFTKVICNETSNHSLVIEKKCIVAMVEAPNPAEPNFTKTSIFVFGPKESSLQVLASFVK